MSINHSNTDRGGIVEVKTDAGGWSIIPNAIFNDPRLDCAARGVMGWFLSRPQGWVIRIEAMRRANNLTEHTWQKNISKQLIEAGYLITTRGHRDGRYCWIYTVFAVSQIPLSENTIPQKQGIENAALDNIEIDANIAKLISEQLAKAEAKKQQMIARSRDKATKRDKEVAELKRQLKEHEQKITELEFGTQA